LTKLQNPRLPSKQKILDFIKESLGRVGKREIGRAFRIKGADRIPLKHLLKEMREEGLIGGGRGDDQREKQRVTAKSGLPLVAVIEITGPDADGKLMGRPTVWHDEGPPPVVYMVPEHRGRPALGPGERVLSRLTRMDDHNYEARTIRVIAGRSHRVFGLFSKLEREGRIKSTDRRHKSEFVVLEKDSLEAKTGELVLGEVLSGRHRGLPTARVMKRLGHIDAPGAISLVCIHSHDIPTDFPDEAISQAEAASPVSLDKREDLRSLPLVTIDGPDARDFDDAVWAEPDPDPDNKDGWHLVVAIADVAHYVRPGDALDHCAENRGNSVYFPDRVVPMLPEALSNGLCSLRPDEERPCLAVHMWLDRDGDLQRHRFIRGLMRSAARLTYSQVQNAKDGHGNAAVTPILNTVINPLYGAFASLSKARERRGVLDLDLPERLVTLDESGNLTGIETHNRLDSHRLIEEFMITANVAAAETLSRSKRPCMYRVHEPPNPSKVEALRDFLKSFGYSLPSGRVMRPRSFSHILHQASASDHAPLISEIILRTQSKAVYSPENLGHFGLALDQYAHFTSPIRRYSDLLVHRSLIDALKLGKHGLSSNSIERFNDIADHISTTERRAEAAERDAFDRYAASFLSDRVGAKFSGRINGVTRFGLFIILDETGANGLVPIRSLGTEFFDHDEAHHCLCGRATGKTFTLGGPLIVRLIEANPVTGGMQFEILEGGSERKPAPATSGKKKRITKRRGANASGRQKLKGKKGGP